MADEVPKQGEAELLNRVYRDFARLLPNKHS
jgi:hypothetical protein